VDVVACTHMSLTDMFLASSYDSMTDGRDFNKMSLYCYRAGLHINRPACIVYHGGTRVQGKRRNVLKELEDRGMTMLLSDESLVEAIDTSVPDSLGKTEEELEKMPRLIRSYRCGNLIEKGLPFCGDEKYNLTFCEKRKFKASWHQGW
jgi:hypothetical protein